MIDETGLCIDKWPVLGVVYNPITDELFSAAKDLGAFLNSQVCLSFFPPSVGIFL